MTARDELVDTARYFHSWHKAVFGWWCVGCRLIDTIDQEDARDA